MRVAIILPRCALSDNRKELSPCRMYSVSSDFEVRSQPTELLHSLIGKASAVLAEAIDSHACEDENNPATSVFQFFVASPNCPGQGQSV